MFSREREERERRGGGGGGGVEERRRRTGGLGGGEERKERRRGWRTEGWQAGSLAWQSGLRYQTNYYINYTLQRGKEETRTEERGGRTGRKGGWMGK